MGGVLIREILYGAVFIACVGVFARSRSRVARQSVLLLGSYAVYLTWSKWFAAVLLFSTVVNFLFGRWMREEPSKLILSLGILFNLALLGSFKYVPDIVASIPFSSVQRFAHLALPLGISFWTFQAMSYLFDLYCGEALDPSFIEFALYMVFFPVAISGPICRMPEMLPQFRSTRLTQSSDLLDGLSRIATGIFMMELARLLGQGILSGDGIRSGFDQANRWTGPDVWCLAIGYGLQLFLDFAGYSHIAIGAARALGFTIPENFARPFQSTSPSIFWTRWHMSLSFWIRDYVFLPLAVIRREVWWRNLVLVGSMVLFGVWHKATVLFVIWGCYHGVLLVLHRQVQQIQRKFDWTPPERAWSLISWAVTMGLVSLGWIFFRANSLFEARQMLSAALAPHTYSSHILSTSLYGLVASAAIGYGLVHWIAQAIREHTGMSEASGVQRRSGLVSSMVRNRWFWVPPVYLLALLLILIVTHTRGADPAQFMYRNF
jgi:alginate O-acetyltransferase complex protein AlgI